MQSMSSEYGQFQAWLYRVVIRVQACGPHLLGSPFPVGSIGGLPTSGDKMASSSP